MDLDPGRNRPWEPKSFQCNLTAQLTFHRPCQQYLTVVLISTIKCHGCCLQPNPDGVALDLIMGIYILLETVLILKRIFSCTNIWLAAI